MPVSMAASAVALGLGGGALRLWLSAVEALENATKEVGKTVAVTTGAASSLVKVISSSAEEIVVAFSEELVELIRLIAQVPRVAADGVSQSMCALMSHAAVLGLMLFAVL